MVGTRSHEQFRNMRLAGLRLRRIRIDGIQHQHRAGLEILTQTGVVGKRRIRTEHVIAIVVAHLRLSGRNHDTLARERLAQALQTRRRVLGGLQRLDLRLVVIPTGGHELLERLGTPDAANDCSPIAHGLIRSRAASRSIFSYSLSLSVMTSPITSPEHAFVTYGNYRNPSYNFFRRATFMRTSRMGKV